MEEAMSFKTKVLLFTLPFLLIFGFVTQEEQSVTANGIAKSVSQILQGIQEINANISQSSEVSGGIAREIAEVNQASAEMSNNAKSVSGNAVRLKGLSDDFNKLVSTFKV